MNQPHRRIEDALRISPDTAARPADTRTVTLRQRDVAQAENIRFRAESTAAKAAKS